MFRNSEYIPKLMTVVVAIILIIAPICSGVLLVDRYGRKTVLKIGQVMLITILITNGIFQLLELKICLLIGIFGCNIFF